MVTHPERQLERLREQLETGERDVSEADADAYVCVNTTTTRTLIWQVARAMERHELIAENRRLQQTQQHRLQLEHDEATRLLQQQRLHQLRWQLLGL